MLPHYCPASRLAILRLRLYQLRTSKYEKAIKLAPQAEGQHQNEVCELMQKSGYFWNPDREEWKLEPLLAGNFPLIHK